MSSNTEESPQQWGRVYMFKNKINGKVYIGQTVRWNERKREHKSRSAKNPKYLFGRALRKYGWENFERICLIDDVPEEDLSNLEMSYIEFYNSNNPAFGYNLTKGGEGAIGYKHTDATKVKMSQAQQNRSAEHQAKLNLAQKGHLDKISRANKGRKHTDEAKAKISRANKGRKHTDEARANMSEAQKGKKLSAATKAKISRAKQNMSDTTKAKMSRAANKKPLLATEMKTGLKRNFESAHAAARTLSDETGKNFFQQNVCACANKRRKSHHGWTFSHL